MTLFMCATCTSSLSFSSDVKARETIAKDVRVVAADTTEVALFAAAAAAYGWLANKTYDLGKEVGKSFAGSKHTLHTFDSQSPTDSSAEYLLD